MIDPTVEQILTLLIALASALYAWIQKRQAATATAEQEQTVAFFDPESPVTTPPASLPRSTYTMSESTKQFLLAGHDSVTQAAIEGQVLAAEEAGKTRYTVSFPNGYYLIEWGTIVGGSRD